jgi:LysM repeat protein
VSVSKSSYLGIFAFALALFGQPAPVLASTGSSTSKEDTRLAGARGPAKECKYRTPIYMHRVQPGEHLGLIAGYYGVTRKDLVELNSDLSNPDKILVGQQIRVCPEIPPREEKRVTHVIKPGENLASIAKRYELEIEALLEMQAEGLDDPNKIWVGQKLTVVLPGEIVEGFEPKKPKRGRLGAATRMPKGDGYILRRPHLAYGTERTVSLLQKVIKRYRKRAGGGPELHIGDISKKSGGPLSGHLSHQRGVDVDVGLVLKGKDAHVERFLAANDSNLDVRRTWVLVHEFLRTGRVRYIFLDYEVQKELYHYAESHGVSKERLDMYFQYPRGRGRGHGLIRHWRNHRDHMHVRFRE